MSQINTELGRGSTTSITIDTAEGGGYGTINVCSASRPSSANPASISEWYNYNHSLRASTYLTGAEGPTGDAAGACALSIANAYTIYTLSSVYYFNDICTTVITDGYYRDSTSSNSYYFVGGALISSAACATTTTTTTTTTTAGCACISNVCTSACPNADNFCADLDGCFI